MPALPAGNHGLTPGKAAGPPPSTDEVVARGAVQRRLARAGSRTVKEGSGKVQGSDLALSEEELQAGMLKLKRLSDQLEVTVPRDQLLQRVCELLGDADAAEAHVVVS